MPEKPKTNPLLVVVPIIAIVAAIVGIEMHSGSANGQSAEKPVAITVQKAAAALQKVIPDIKVESVNPSPIEGIWEVVVVTPQGKRVGYIDSEARFLISGSLIDLSSGADLTRAKADDLNRVDFASIPLKDAVVLGNPKAAKKVVVFDDPD